MDMTSPSLPGSPIEDAERIEILLDLDPDSSLYQYLTWLENEVERLREEAERAYRDSSRLKRLLATK